MAKKNIGCSIGPDSDSKWRAEDDLRTLTRAREIEADRARMAAAQKTANEQRRALDRIAPPRQERRAPAKSATRSSLAKRRI